jgi:hypothetical protein
VRAFLMEVHSNLGSVPLPPGLKDEYAAVIPQNVVAGDISCNLIDAHALVGRKTWHPPVSE